MVERVSHGVERRIALGFAVSVALVFVLGAVSLLALRRSVASDRQAFDEANELIELSRFQSATERKMTSFRGYLLSGEVSYLRDLATSRNALRAMLGGLSGRANPRERELLARVERAEQAHEIAVQDAIKLRRSGASPESVAAFFTSVVEPRREEFEAAIAPYLDFKRQTVRQAHRRSQEQNNLAGGLILLLTIAAIGVVAALGVILPRRLARSIEMERRQRGWAEAASWALVESEERKAAILDSSLDAMITIDQEGKILEFNPAAERLFGYTQAEAAGQEMAELLMPERMRQQHRDGMARYRETGVARILGQRIEMPALRRDGAEFSVELAIRAIRTGRETLFTAFVRDITQRKRTEEERTELLEREREARARAEAAESRSAFLAAASQVLGSSLDYRTTLSSVARLAVPEVADWCFIDMVQEGNFRRVAVAHRWPEHAVLARELEERHLLDPDARQGPPHVIRTGEAELLSDTPDEFFRTISRSSEDYELLARMGIRSYMCVPMRAREEILGLLTFLSTDSSRRYTTEDLRLAEELASRAGGAIDNARLYRDAREAIHLRDDFLSIASHELKTPITTLQLQIQSLTRQAQSGDVLPDKLRARFGAAERQMDRLTRLVGNLLDISRITAGRLDLERETVDLEAVVREALSRFSDELERAGCAVEFRIEGSAHVGQWDRIRVEQIVTNLLSNAVKYGAGRPVEVTLSGDAKTSLLTVRDYGIGIPPEDQARIFGRFERAVSVRHYGGLGLGLWIVRQIVEAFGGRISVESRPSEGSTFTVELPHRSEQESTEQAGS